jgi:hypothetical protein
MLGREHSDTLLSKNWVDWLDLLVKLLDTDVDTTRTAYVHSPFR